MADSEKLDYGKVRRFWNERAGKEGEIDRRSITFFCTDREALDFRDGREKKLFDELVKVPADAEVLEAGCGSGRWTGFLAERFRKVTAFDFAGNLVGVNRRAAEDAGLTNIEYHVSDVLSLDLLRKDFDAAVCFGIALYVRDSDLVPFFKKFREHLKPGGALLAKEPLADSGRIEKIDEYSEKLETNYSCIYRNRAEWEEAVIGAGFAKDWVVPVYRSEEPLAPDRDGLNTWFGCWRAV